MVSTPSSPVDCEGRKIVRELFTGLECAAVEMRDALKTGRCTNPAGIAQCARSLYQAIREHGDADRDMLRQMGGDHAVDLYRAAVVYGQAVESGTSRQQWTSLLELIRCCLSV